MKKDPYMEDRQLAAPKEIVDLVERFERNLLEYKSSTYNEAQTRKEFIDPFFKALGWDMDNERGFTGSYKDVLYESSLKVGSSTKAPDYAFVINDIKFLVEAKKPSVNLEENADPAYQLRSYAWNAKLPISILTDFEELAIYDCRYPPKETDKADTARINFLKYTDYVTCWDWISSKFSKTAIQQGYLDKFLKQNKDKKGTKEVDTAFLEAISDWREYLARNIALRNPELSVEELNTCVQATIDRIVFLRICEDRGIEKYGQIQDIANRENIYAGLCDLFKHADDRYNSGLFHFKKEFDREYPDLLALDLKIDDEVLRDITSSLYPPSPYNFAIISPEILGMVYEQFLGKVIRLTDGHRAKIEEKPEVKKAGGIKYTPTYIVQNIVRKTLDPLIKGKTPVKVALIRVLDPACGSGSFLLVAYKYLLDWHLDWYIKNLAPVLDKGQSVTSAAVRSLLPVSDEENGNDKNQKIKTGTKAKKIKARAKERAGAASVPIYKTNDGEWHLTITERKRILLNNIYGVDIDHQAVEVTKLSLLLKVLEGENQQTVSDLLKYSRERVLPDLDDNIKCGNSLIGTDIIQTDDWQKMSKIDQDRINPFDWGMEFAEIMQEGGFHAIIGNPPYVRIQVMKEWAAFEVEYFKKRYASAKKGNYDIYVTFAEKGLELLNKDGRLGFILPHKFFNVNYGQPLRALLSAGRNLSEIIHFGDQQVFEGAMTYTCLLFLVKAGVSEFRFCKVTDINNWRTTDRAECGSLPADSITDAEWNFTLGKSSDLLKKLKNMPIKLGDVSERIFQGLVTGADQVFTLQKNSKDDDAYYSELTGKMYHLDKELLHPLCKSSDNVHRYNIWEIDKSMIFPYKFIDGKAILLSEKDMRDVYPRTWEYLQDNRDKLESRERGKWKHERWYAFGRSQNLNLVHRPKIICQVLSTRGNFALDIYGKFYFLGGGTAGCYAIVDKDDDPNTLKYLLGILNSKLTTYFVSNIASGFKGGFFAFGKSSLKDLPIPTKEIWNDINSSQSKRMVNLVDIMLSLHEQQAGARTSHEQNRIQRQIEATDNQIEQLVYEIYGLTDEEILIIEKEPEHK